MMSAAMALAIGIGIQNFRKGGDFTAAAPGRLQPLQGVSLRQSVRDCRTDLRHSDRAGTADRRADAVRFRLRPGR